MYNEWRKHVFKIRITVHLDILDEIGVKLQ